MFRFQMFQPVICLDVNKEKFEGTIHHRMFIEKRKSIGNKEVEVKEKYLVLKEPVPKGPYTLHEADVTDIEPVEGGEFASEEEYRFALCTSDNTFLLEGEGLEMVEELLAGKKRTVIANVQVAATFEPEKR